MEVNISECLHVLDHYTLEAVSEICTNVNISFARTASWGRDVRMALSTMHCKLFLQLPTMQRTVDSRCQLVVTEIIVRRPKSQVEPNASMQSSHSVDHYIV